ncbi:MAG: hypothetical protein ACOYJG_11595 [Prevotella sp.]|jgi:bisphosphoglycerate-dependent phosphoglycerate mutase
MILFVFEGPKGEVRCFDTIRELFFPKDSSTFKCVYKSNIYSLYKKLSEYDVFDGDALSHSGETVAILNEILMKQNDTTLQGVKEDDVSEIYLFFDYDFQDSRHTLEENNKRVSEMLDYFSDETENGKLYINYPMVESLFYTKELPDNNYWKYCVKREDCHDKKFKRTSREFCAYHSDNYILLTEQEFSNEEKKRKAITRVFPNWKALITMNVEKANYIVNSLNELPEDIGTISPSEIFQNELSKFVNIDYQVSILNSFPIFIYEYFGKGIV